MSKAAALVLPDSWSNLTQQDAFIYCSSTSLAASLPNSWSKLENIQFILIDGEYGTGAMYPCRKPALSCQFLTITCEGHDAISDWLA